MGFSTGRWEGNHLVVTTTHLKQGWLRRNGVPESDQTTMVERFIRHDKYLTHVAIISDPVYLDRADGPHDRLLHRDAGQRRVDLAV